MSVDPPPFCALALQIAAINNSTNQLPTESTENHGCGLKDPASVWGHSGCFAEPEYTMVQASPLGQAQWFDPGIGMLP